MRAEYENSAEYAVVVAADDLRILILARAVFTGKGYRVLAVNGACNAVRFLTYNQDPIHSVAIRAGMQPVEDRERPPRQGARPRTSPCAVNGWSWKGWIRAPIGKAPFWRRCEFESKHA